MWNKQGIFSFSTDNGSMRMKIRKNDPCNITTHIEYLKDIFFDKDFTMSQFSSCVCQKQPLKKSCSCGMGRIYEIKLCGVCLPCFEMRSVLRACFSGFLLISIYLQAPTMFEFSFDKFFQVFFKLLLLFHRQVMYSFKISKIICQHPYFLFLRSFALLFEKAIEKEV